MKHASRFAACLILLGWMTPAPRLESKQADIVTGTRTGAESVRLAVPLFMLDLTGAGGQELTGAFNETLWDDLDFSGVVLPISRSFYPLGRFGRPADVDVSAWTAPGVDAQFLTFGGAFLNGNSFVIEAYLWDLRTRIEDRETFSLRMTTEATEAAVRLMAHKYADRIIDDLGGGRRGIFQTKIAFESTRTTPADKLRVKEIFVMDYDGHNQYQLTTDADLAVTPNWSADNSQIGYTSYAAGTAQLALISPVDRRGFPFPNLGQTNTMPSWSSDGTRIAYVSSKAEVRGVPDQEIFVYNTATGTDRRLTNSRGVDVSPVWNPATNNQIAFVSDRFGTPQIFIIDAEGGNLRRIETSGGEAVSPAWSPDGQTIAFSWLRPGSVNRNIYIYDVASRGIAQLTQEGSGDNDFPTWSPDGRHLAFESNRGGSSQIYSMLADGSKVRQLTQAGTNHNPSWSNYVER
jgi:TolB protein